MLTLATEFTKEELGRISAAAVLLGVPTNQFIHDAAVLTAETKLAKYRQAEN